MSSYIVGVGLMIAGVAIFFVDRRRSKLKTVNASKGSVAVGGDNAGPITNINVGAQSETSGGHAVTVVSIVVEVIGIIVVIWHAIHLASK